MPQGSTSTARRPSGWRRLSFWPPALGHAILICTALVLLLPGQPVRAQGYLKLLQPAATQPGTGRANAPNQPQIPTEPRRFDAVNGLFKVMLPPGWTLAHDPGNHRRYDGEISGGRDGLLWFTVSPTEPGVSPRTLAHIVRSDALHVFPELKIIEHREAQLGGFDGYYLACDSTSKSGAPIRVILFISGNDRNTFAFRAVMSLDRYEAFGRELDFFARSFEITGVPVESPEGRYRVLLPPGAKLTPYPRNPRRQTYDIGPSAVIIFEWYSIDPTHNAPLLFGNIRKDLASINSNYKELQVKMAPPGVRVDLINGYFVDSEYTGKDGVRWRNSTYCADGGNLVCFAMFIAPAGAPYDALWPAARRVISSFHENEPPAVGEDPDMRTVTAASGDFEIDLPRKWLLVPSTAERVPHAFMLPGIGEDCAINSYTLPVASSLDEELAIAVKTFQRGDVDPKPSTDADIKLGPLPARMRHVDVTREDGVVYRMTVVAALHGSRVYSFWVKTPLERVPFLKPLMDKMCASFILVPPPDPDKFTLYQDKERRFRLKYPDALRPVPPIGDEIVRIAARPSGPAARYLDNVVINRVMFGRHPDLTVEHAADHYAQSHMRLLNGGAVGEWRDVNVGGKKAKRVIYNMSVTAMDGGGVNVTKMVFIVIHDQQAYAIRVQARQPNFDLFVATGQRVVDSIEWMTGTEGDKNLEPKK